jgi:hypothetical protein
VSSCEVVVRNGPDPLCGRRRPCDEHEGREQVEREARAWLQAENEIAEVVLRLEAKLSARRVRTIRYSRDEYGKPSISIMLAE